MRNVSTYWLLPCFIWLCLSSAPVALAQTNSVPLIETSPAPAAPAAVVPSPPVPAPAPVVPLAPVQPPAAPQAAAPAAASSIDPAAVVPPMFATPTAPAVAPVAAAPPEPPKEEIDPNVSTAPVLSILFRVEEINALRKAVAAFERNKNAPKNAGDDYLSKLGDMADKISAENPPQVRYFVYPQFFLESLAYHSPADWIVHISHRALTQDHYEVDGIRVVSIDKDKVSIEWTPTDIEKVSESWAVAHNENVQVDLERKLVGFTLHPNQTFSSYVMRVIEGKVAPVVIVINNAPNAPAKK